MNCFLSTIICQRARRGLQSSWTELRLAALCGAFDRPERAVKTWSRNYIDAGDNWLTLPDWADWLTFWATAWQTGRLSNWLACSSFLPQAEIGKLPQTLCTSTAARQVQCSDANWHKLKNLYMVQAIFHCCCLSCCCCCCYWPRHFHFARAGSSDSGRGFYYFPISFWFCVQIKIE